MARKAPGNRLQLCIMQVRFLSTPHILGGTMKIFILEDMPQRIEIFKEKFKDHKLYFADNVVDAKKIFNENVYFLSGLS